MTVDQSQMTDVILTLSEQEIDIILNALEFAVENSDEYDRDEYEEVLYDLQRKLDEDEEDEVE